MELTFPEALEKAKTTLMKIKNWVLATSLNNRVSARTISVIVIGQNIYFQTEMASTKYRVMAKNPQIALCNGNCSIEGTAVIRGHPAEEKNKEFIRLYRSAHPKAFHEYTGLEKEAVIEIRPQIVKYWEYDADHDPWYIVIDLIRKKVECNNYLEKKYMDKKE